MAEITGARICRNRVSELFPGQDTGKHIEQLVVRQKHKRQQTGAQDGLENGGLGFKKKSRY